jgi:hypothetical protein
VKRGENHVELFRPGKEMLWLYMSFFLIGLLVADIMLPDLSRVEGFFADFPLSSLPKKVEKEIAKKVEVKKLFVYYFKIFFELFLEKQSY